MRQTVTTNSTRANLPLETEYRSDTHDLVHDFCLPCLERSTLYRRAVGYFNSRGLSLAAQGMTAVSQGGGRMLLVASPLFATDEELQQRVQELAHKANEGTLTVEEQREYQAYVDAGDSVAMLQAVARKTLQAVAS